MRKLLIVLLMAVPLTAAEADPDQLVTVEKRFVSAEGIAKAHPGIADTTVTVERKFVSTEGLQSIEKSLPEKASQYVGLGKEIGVAVHEGLNAVVDDANKFSTTPVGKFVMVMIAFKIMGKQAMNVFIGLPIYFFGVCLWIYLYRRMLMPSRVLVKQEGNTKTWEMRDPLAPWGKDSDEVKQGVLVCAWISIVLWHLLMLMIIFGAFNG